MTGTCKIDDEECTQRQEHGTGDISGKVSTAWREGNDTHQIDQEDEEETREQIRCILISFLTLRHLNHIIIY